MKKLLTISFSLLALSAMAQEQPVKDTSKSGLAIVTAPLPPMPDTNIRVYEPAVIRNTVQKVYDYQRYSHGTSPGFRVQIDFSQESNKANKTKSDFSGKYPGVPSYITYKQPYFRVSVGDFRCKLDAVRCLNSVKKDYPAAFIVSDKIIPPPLQ
jgi:SPOR domain